MRIWSLHPAYLDPAGLVAVWREALLARKVLENKTSGYRHHPQLDRFKTCRSPAKTADRYLRALYLHSLSRGYHFDSEKLYESNRTREKIFVTDGQLDFELKHLLRKLRVRCPARWRELRGLEKALPHPLFTVVPGPAEPWEKTPGRTRPRRRKHHKNSLTGRQKTTVQATPPIR
ncbi:MAG: pyrimidine dimer DNA glycosylase/endonuclease V [Elusimicrobiaceae bacterium]|nr:pyrimidine dimer DNA glycosylase/endonuclease V [Elusimicrobiaceae bacterium]